LIPPTASSSCRRDWGGEGKRIRKARLAMKREVSRLNPSLYLDVKTRKANELLGVEERWEIRV